MVHIACFSYPTAKQTKRSVEERKNTITQKNLQYNFTSSKILHLLSGNQEPLNYTNIAFILERPKIAC